MLRDMDAIRSAAGQRGSGNTMWFNSNTMFAWGTRVSEIVFATPQGAVFVTSERSGRSDRASRMYSIRHILDSGQISTVSFQGHSDRRAALRAAQRHASKISHPAYSATPENDVPISN